MVSCCSRRTVLIVGVMALPWQRVVVISTPPRSIGSVAFGGTVAIEGKVVRRLLLTVVLVVVVVAADWLRGRAS